jgi:alginate O-acetyltransferase complex protein AlgI
MLFSSLTFLFAFLPLVMGLYFVVRNRMWRNVVLLVASLLFYAWGEPRYIVLMLVSIVFNFGWALLLDAKKGSAASLAGKHAREALPAHKPRLLLGLGIAVNIALIGVFKYLDFGLASLGTLFPIALELPGLALPIGISFYTFQAISYLIDVYRGRTEAQRNVLLMGVYIAMFPQLIAGPIVRYDQIAVELTERKETLGDVAEGARRFVFGLAKKVLIANNCAVIADGIYNQAGGDVGLGAPILWLAALAYFFQIYFDFSGYSDMAIGLGRMFGFTVPENFNYPYSATSVSGFWRRWHMSLTSWFRDYVYIPLGGNRVSKPRWVLNMFIVWALTGLWHGAAWNFVLWGFFFGVILVIERFAGVKRWDEDRSTRLRRAVVPLRWLLTMFIVLISWVLFRVEGFDTLGQVLVNMFTVPGDLGLLWGSFDMLNAAPWLLVAAVACFPQFRRRGLAFCERGAAAQAVGYLVTLAVYAISIAMLLSATYNPFIYFRF